MNSKLNQKIHKWLDGGYFVGIMDNLDGCIDRGEKPNIHWIDLKDYDEGWFADPFILERNADTTLLLVEEFRYDIGRGRISLLTIDNSDYSLLKVEPVLECPFHLSFPYIINDGDSLMICPESGQAKVAALYSIADLTGKGKAPVMLGNILNGHMIDTQLAKIDGAYYAFTVESHGKGLDDTRLLQVFRSESLHGPYTKIQEIANNRREERGAGTIFMHNGRWIRPAQICEGGYGKGVVLYQLEQKDGKFAETEIRRIMADKRDRNGLCFHTFSVHGNIAAVDGLDYPCRLIGKLAPYLYGIKTRLDKWLRKPARH